MDLTSKGGERFVEAALSAVGAGTREESGIFVVFFVEFVADWGR